MVRAFPLVLALMSACGTGDAPDTRVVGTLYTGTCYYGGRTWLGVERVNVALEHAPGNLTDRSLPLTIGSCSKETVLFADEGRFDGGADFPKLGEDAGFQADDGAGSLSKTRDGLWTGDVTPNGGCREISEVAASGLTLEEVGALDGVTTPAPSDPGLVYIGDDLDQDWPGEIARGSTMELSWTASGWDESFVQIREYNGATLRQTLTCNTTGLDRFRLDDTVWGQMDDLGAQTLEIYVGFQNVTSEKKGGETAEVVTRIAQVIQQDD